MEYLVVDGYNVINAWKDIFDIAREPLGDSRDKLLSILSDYQGYNNSNIIVVFDAHMVKGSKEKNEVFDNLTVIYTKENETADNYIEKFVYRMGSTNTIKVVTLDYLEQRTILNYGGVRMSPRELMEDIKQAKKDSKPPSTSKQSKISAIMSRIKPELREQLEKIRRDKF